jgi:hypothetical protein
MRRFALACMLALVVLSCTAVLAQTTYQVTYYDNNFGQRANGTSRFPLDSGTIRIINTGFTGSPISADMGTLCANLYVFDDTQEMVECCSCPVTANGLLTLSVQDLTENPLTLTPFRGVIKLVSTIPTGGVCDPTAISTATVGGDLQAFATHLQNASIGAANVSGSAGLSAGYYFLTEEEFAPAPLVVTGPGSEGSDLGTICSFVRYLGTGRGRCDDECDEPVGGD